MKKTIEIHVPSDIETSQQRQWAADYDVCGDADAKLIQIEARSFIEVIVAKITRNTVLGPDTSYYISSPNFNVAIPCIPSLLEGFWIREKLMDAGMPMPDAVTVSQVLRDMEDF